MIRFLLAYFRLNKRIVCEESRDGWDFHDYPDATTPTPMHMHNYTCRRCGKLFYI